MSLQQLPLLFDRHRVAFTLGSEHPRRKRVRRVTGQNGHTLLFDHFAAVVFVGADVHGATRLAVAGVEHRFVNVAAIHAFAAVIGQQRWMDIEHALCEVAFDRQQP